MTHPQLARKTGRCCAYAILILRAGIDGNARPCGGLFLMMDSPLTEAEESTAAEVSTPPPEPSFFRRPALPSGFVRVCLYLIMGEAIAYGLQWAARFFLHGTLSPYDPQLLMAGESVALIGAVSSARLMALLERRTFGAYGLPL